MTKNKTIYQNRAKYITTKQKTLSLQATGGSTAIQKKYKMPAFSLVEMLMALLVASLLLAALAPVITKRPKEVTYEEDVTLKSGKAVYSSPGEYTFIVPENVYELKIQASAGGGGGGGAATKSYTQIYTNPDEIPSSSTNWTIKQTTIPVKKGWYSLDYDIIGPGGYGGHGFGKKLTGANSLCETDPQSPSDTIKKFKRIPKAADSGRDLCFVPIHLTGTYLSTYFHVVDAQTQDSYARTCWVGKTNSDTTTISGSYDADTRTICKRGASCGANLISRYNGNLSTKNIRNLTESEIKRIVNMSNFSSYTTNYLGKNYLDLTCYVCNGGIFSRTTDYMGCHGKSYCRPSRILLQNGYTFDFIFTNLDGTKKENLDLSTIVREGNDDETGEPKCVYEILDWQPYTGSGGPSGGRTTGSIKIKNNGDSRLITSIYAAILPLQAGETQNIYGGRLAALTYIEDGKTLANLGAWSVARGIPANDGDNGAEAPNDYLVTNKRNCTSLNENNVVTEKSCTYATAGTDSNLAGRAGSDTQGGQGSGGAQGGTTGADTFDEAKGKDATKPGYGGGGGACKRDARTGTDCSPGGKGGPAQITLTFKTASAGGGGGAGGAIGYNSDTNVKNTLKIDVKPKDVIRITVGKGGSGGGIGSKGDDGKDTTIVMKNDKIITFKGGKGGSAGTFDDTNIQSGNAGGGLGGNYPDKNNYKEVVAPLTAKGISGSLDNGGYAGGEGGSTVLAYKGGCGGMQKDTGENARCTSANENGADALPFDPINNQNGGAGGGGGGFNPETGTAGTGGSGANGYVVIEWGT